MNNIKNNLILIFGVLSILVFSLILILPNTSHAYLANAAYTYCDGICTGSNGYNNYGNTANIPSPVVYSLSPSNAEIDAKTKTVTINGTGFRPDSIARWNSSDRPTSYVNQSRLIMELDPTDIKTTGKYLVTVVNPTPEGGKFSNSKVFTVRDNSNIVGSTGSSSNTKVKTVKAVAGVSSITNSSTNISSTDESNTSFSASAVKGNGGFMPSTVLGWLMLFTLIFLLVLLWRKLWVTREERARPLKHA